MGLPAVSPAHFLFLGQMRGMVSRHNVDGPVLQALPEVGDVLLGHPIGQGVGPEALDRRPVAAEEQRPGIESRK